MDIEPVERASQFQIVRSRLASSKTITRNWALGRGITRLAAIIAYFKKQGYVFVTRKVGVQEDGITYDYLYEVVRFPKIKGGKK